MTKQAVLNPIDNFLYKQYTARYNLPTLEAVVRKFKEVYATSKQENLSSDKLNSYLRILQELAAYSGYKEKLDGSDPKRLCFMAGGTIGESGLQEPLPQPAMEYLRESGTLIRLFTFGPNSNLDTYFCLVDISPNSYSWQEYHRLFSNANNTCSKTASIELFNLHL